MAELSLPAWSYLYVHQARAMAAWAWLRQRKVRSAGRAQLVRNLAQLFKVTERQARNIIRQGDGLFWEDGPQVEVTNYEELKDTVLADAWTELDATISLPESALTRLQTLRAYMSQAALTRGSHPVLRSYSEQLLGVKTSSITSYRNRLKADKRLEAIPRYGKVGKERFGQEFERNEFTKQGYVWKRLADVIIITNQNGDIVDLLVEPPTDREADKMTETLQATHWASDPPVVVTQYMPTEKFPREDPPSGQPKALLLALSAG